MYKPIGKLRRGLYPSRCWQESGQRGRVRPRRTPV